jgi:hypothetical protein
VTLTNISSVIIGGVLMLTKYTYLWWLGLALFSFGVAMGLIMGSWFQLLPRSKPIGRRPDSR